MHAPYNADIAGSQAQISEPPVNEQDATNAKVHVTFFKNFAAKTNTTDKLTLMELRERVLDAAAREKGKLPWLKLAIFGKKRTDENSLRHDANVTQITGIELDYDDEEIAFDDAVNAVKAMGISALIYTSPSHSAAAPRWRVLVPTSRPLPPETRAKLVAQLNGFLKTKLGQAKIAASESFVLSQAYFYGWVMNKQGLDHRAEVILGDFIDLRNDLAQYEAAGAKVDGAKASADQLATGNGMKRGKGDEELIALLKQSRATPGKGWREPMLPAIGSMVGKGWSDSQIKVACAPYSDGGVDDRDIQKLIDDARKKFGKPEPDDTLPIIDVRGGELSKLTSRGEEILNGAGVQIYQRSRQLVRPVVEEVDATRGRKTKICQLIQVVPDYLRDLLCRHARWQILAGKKMVPIDPPRGIAATMLARTGEWRLFPAVCGVTSAPTMRPDGSLMTEPGFDHKTGLLLVEPPPMPAIPDSPTKADAEGALKLLEDLLVGFPFVDDVAHAGALSALVTAVARGAFPVTPLHASRAPTAGSGKSFLWDIVAAIITGHPMPVISTGKDEIETEKRLGAALMTGQPLISIDNISGELGGDALCQIIERPVVDIRVLGQSKNMRIEARGTSVYATGNNFTLVGDICRRVITINLDAGMERPELRQFDFDPIERVLADRGKYIAAALTICRAYFVAGRPDKAPKLASFEGWSDTVRSALIWLGKEDPVKSMEVARQEDPELVELAEMLEAWSEVMGVGGESRAKLSDVLLRAGAMCRESDDSELVPTYPRLNAALKVVGQRYLGKPALPDARLLGKWLQRFKGRPVGGKKFMNLPDPKHGAQWWIEGPQQAGEPQQQADDDPRQGGMDFNSAKPQRER